MSDLNDIKVFAAVARDKSFTRAARTLKMPKSTVSERIARLEGKLGVRLLERTTRSLRLTASGASYLGRVEKVLQELEEADAAVTVAHTTPRGVLRIGSPLLLAQVFLADVVADYLERFPGVEVEMVLGDRSFDMVEESLDVAIHVVGPMDSQLIARKLGVGRRVCVATPALLEQRPAPNHPAELADLPCVVNGASRMVTWTFERGRDLRSVAVKARYAVGSLELVYRATLKGLGFAVLPEFLCADDVGRGALVRVLPEWSAGETTVHIVYPSQRHLAARVRAFVDVVVERIDEFPPHRLESPSRAARSGTGA